MSIHNFILQFAFLFAPFIHGEMEQVSPVLWRGSDPKARDIYKLHSKGFKTIISVRTNPEMKKQRLCQQLGMRWVQIKTGVFKTPTFQQIDTFRQVVNDPAMQPCYTSCEVNMDRTGIYVGAYRMVDEHWSLEQVRDEFRKHHQKRWWPIFRKYQRVIASYAEQWQSCPQGLPASEKAK